MNENTKEEKALSPINVVELDYDKLAMAIVQAQEKAKELKLEEKKEASAEIKAEEKKGRIRRFFHKINTEWEIWKANIKEKSQQVTITIRIFSIITSLVLYVIGAIGLLFSFNIMPAFKDEIVNLHGSQLMGNIIFWALKIVAIGYSIMLCISAFEISVSKDKHFIVSVFSALSGFIALVVALVALFK